jgi:hypothetical protein
MIANPFAELSALIPPGVMQTYVVLMILLVIGGTLLDVMHKKSAKYFFEKGQTLKKLAKRDVNSAEKMSIAISTVANEVLASGEFDNPERRKSHLLMMYGFVIFVVTTALQIFSLPAAEGESSVFLSLLWHLGALMVCIGGYWFWFKIRVDVRAEGHEWYDVHLSDLFIVSLLLTTTFALVWSVLNLTIALVIFIAAATTLFSSVFWSKFAHMFYKPAAAFQKKVAKADGSMDKLPEMPELTDPVVKQRYPDIPEYMGDNPPYMGLGIKREAPTHY